MPAGYFFFEAFTRPFLLRPSLSVNEKLNDFSQARDRVGEQFACDCAPGAPAAAGNGTSVRPLLSAAPNL